MFDLGVVLDLDWLEVAVDLAVCDEGMGARGTKLLETGLAAMGTQPLSGEN